MKFEDKRRINQPEGSGAPADALSSDSPRRPAEQSSAGRLRNSPGADGAPSPKSPDAESPGADGTPSPEPPVAEEQHDYLEDLKRVQAEFENYKKRMMREQTAMVERATARLIERLLPVLDNFERAIAHGEGGKGVELVFKEFYKTLEQEGLEEIPAEDVPFDHDVHEAVESIEDPEHNEPTCRTVYRRGYRLKGKVLRPAMVSVARPPSQESPAQSEETG